MNSKINWIKTVTLLLLITFTISGYAREVWINEINIEDGILEPDVDFETGTNSYVELVGKAGTDISGWSLEMYDDANNRVQTYTIKTNTIISNDKDGYGFFVFGAPLVQNKNLTLTNDFNGLSGAQPSYVKTPGGLILKRKFGFVEQKVCFNGESLTSVGFEYIGDDYSIDDDWNPQTNSLQLTGSGKDYSNFQWSLKEGFTPGNVNTEQTLTGGGSTEMTITIANYWFDGTNFYIVSEGTGAWHTPEVWLSTNLAEDLPEWEKIVNVISDVNGNVVTQYFEMPQSYQSPTIYYKIQGLSD